MSNEPKVIISMSRYKELIEKEEELTNLKFNKQKCKCKEDCNCKTRYDETLHQRIFDDAIKSHKRSD